MLTPRVLRDHVHIPSFHPEDVHTKAHTIVLPLGVDGKYSFKSFTKLAFAEGLPQNNELRGCVVKDTKDGHLKTFDLRKARAQMLALSEAGWSALHTNNFSRSISLCAKQGEANLVCLL